MTIRWKVLALLCLAALGELIWLALHPAPRSRLAPGKVPNAGVIGGGDVSSFAPPTDSASKCPAELAEEAGQVFVAPYAELAAALEIPDAQQRQAALSKLLIDWAAHDPDEALAWARSQGGEVRRNAIMDVIGGITGQPQVALRLAPILISQESDHAGDYALALIQGLSNRKDFQAAVQLAGIVPSDARADLLAAVFRMWGAADPQAALQSAAGMDPASHDETFDAVVEGWSISEPGEVAAYAMTMPAGSGRAYALATAMDRWSLQDPAGMSAWLAQAPPSPELDPGIAAMLTRSDGVNRPPALAMTWTQLITDPALRFSTAEHIAQEWKQADPAAALAYTESAAWLTPEQRASLVQIINAPASALDEPGEN